jgi:aryl-alcohol dehydrogenase-like predicted oxidoreductase
MDSIGRSLERLQTDHIDLYQIHQSDIATGVEETMRALDDLVSQRMVRYVGVSNWEAWRIMKANSIADKRGWSRIETNQAYYSIAGRDLEQELVPLMADQQIGCLVWSPLAGGYMAGKYTPGGEAQEPGRRAAFDFPPIDKDMADRIVVARAAGRCTRPWARCRRCGRRVRERGSSAASGSCRGPPRLGQPHRAEARSRRRRGR